MKLPESNNGSFEAAKSGTCLGLCYQIIDIGTQKSEYNGEVKYQRKVLIYWELPSQKTSEGKAKMIRKKYTLSSHEKASLVEDIKTWTGQKIGAGFQLDDLLGKPAWLSIVEEQGHDGNTYVTVKAVSAVPTELGISIPELENPILLLSLEDGEFIQGVFDELSESIKNNISASPEFQELVNQGAAEPYGDVVKQAREASPSEGHASEQIPVNAY